MSQNKLAVEVMDGTGAWIDITADVMGVSIDGVGLTAARGTHARVGRCRLTLKNTTKTYSPDLNAGSALLDGRRRVRVKGTGSSLGKCMQATHNGGYGFGGTTTITASGSNVAVGTSNSLNYRNAQSLIPSAGGLTQITVQLAANVGSPSGTATWELRNDAGRLPGGIVSINASGATVPLGNQSGTTYRQAQAFVPTGGQLSQITFQLGANVGSPTGSLTWEIRTDYGASGPGSSALTAMLSGTLTPLANSLNTIIVSGGPILNSGQKYWFVLYATSPASSGNYYTWVSQNSTVVLPYAADYSTDSGVTWTQQNLVNRQCVFTTAATTTSEPGSTVLATGTFTPTASATNTINVSGTAIPAATCWLVLYSTSVQAGPNNYWTWQTQSTSTYGSGNLAQSSDTGSTWIDFPAIDAQCSVTTGLISNRWRQQITLASVPTDVFTLTWEARAQFDSQYNTEVGRIATDVDTGANTVFTYTNKWASYSANLTCAGTGTVVSAQFFPQFTGNGLNSTFIEYRNVVLRKNGGANLLTNGDFSSGAVSPWVNLDVTTPSATISLAVANDTWILFNGVIEDIVPDPFATAGGLKTTVVCYDFAAILQYQNIDLPLQSNQRSDQLMTTLMGVLPSGTVATTVPGRSFATGRQTFQTAFDGYQKTQTTVLEAIDDAVVSEYGRMWIDRDGTIRASARDTLPKVINSAAKLAFGSGQPFDMLVSRSVHTVINKAFLIYHPRQVYGGAAQAIAFAQAAVQVPPATGATFGQTTVTLNFRDVAGNITGGQNLVLPLVAGTDFTADGEGQVLTNLIQITNYVVSASQITFTLNNGAIGDAFVRNLQVRGIPIYKYDPVTITKSDATSIAKYQERVYSKDLPFTNDQNFAASLADYYLNQYKNPFTEVQLLSVDHRAAIGGVDLLSLDLMDLISITDTQTNLSATKHMIVGVAYELDPTALDYVKNVTFQLERVDSQSYWILDDSTYSVLGASTILYI